MVKMPAYKVTHFCSELYLPWNLLYSSASAYISTSVYLSFSLRLRRPHDELLDVVLSPVVVVEGGGVDAEGGGRLAPAAHGGPLEVERSVVVVFVVVVQEEAEKAQKTRVIAGS